MSFLSRLTSIFSKPSVATRFPGVVVGRIEAITVHPNADRLRLATVDIGQRLEVVCGAANIEPGQLVPVATLGAALPNGIVIQPAIIRGVSSEAMLCAADELGLGTDHSGIHVLKGGRPGQPIDAFI